VKSGGSRKGGDEDQGAGAEGVGRVSLFLLGDGVWRWVVPPAPPQKNFETFYLEIALCGAFWGVLKFIFLSFFFSFYHLPFYW